MLSSSSERRLSLDIVDPFVQQCRQLIVNEMLMIDMSTCMNNYKLLPDRRLVTLLMS